MNDNKFSLDLLIYGTGTIAEIASFYFQNDTKYNIIGFVDDIPSKDIDKFFLNKPVFSLKEAMEKYPTSSVSFFVAIGYKKTNKIREDRYLQIKSHGYKLATYISPKSMVFTDKIGENCFILEGNVIQPYVIIGNNVTMWSGNHIGHHSIVKDNVFITSHVVISGKCTIGKNSFLGVNSCLHDGIDLGEKTIIGAGSIVAKSCDPMSVFLPKLTACRVIKRDIL
jgi:sugar O-acyltransferase (sialic acid O-acetyltransferase NeuD family)